MPGSAFEPNISEIQRAMQSLQVEDEEGSSIRSDSGGYRGAHREEPKPYEFGCSGRGTDGNNANDDDYENNDDNNNNDDDDDDVLDNKTEHVDDQSNNSNTEDDNENTRINQNSYKGSGSESTTSGDSHTSGGLPASGNPDLELDLHSSATNSTEGSDSPVVVHHEANIVPQAVTIIGVDNGVNTPNFQLTKKDANSDQNLNIIVQATREEGNRDQLDGRNNTDDQQDEENDTGHYASGKITLMIPWTEEVDVNSDEWLFGNCISCGFKIPCSDGSRISPSGGANPQGGANIRFWQNFPKNCMKLK